MTPKEKAEELIKKMKLCLFSDGYYDAKQCALIAVDEIIKITCLKDLNYKKYINDNSEFISYWKEVKTEIEKL